MTRTGTKPGLFYGYIITAASFGVWLTGWGTSPTFSIFFLPVSTEFGWSRADTALAYSLNTIVAAILAIVMGWLTDKLGPRIVVCVFGSFLGIAYLLMSQVNALWQFQISYALVAAIGFSTINAPVMSTIARWFVKKRALMIGFIQAGGGMGGLIFAPFVGWLILTYGWRSSYLILGITSLTIIVISGLFLKRDPRATDQLPDGASMAYEPEKGDNSDLQTRGLSLRQAIGTSQFWMIAGLFFSLGFYRSSFLAHLAAHVQDQGFSLAEAANVVAIMTGSTIIGRIGMGRVADTIGNRLSYITSFVVTGVSFAWIMVTHSLWGLCLFALLFGFGWGTQAVLRFATSSEAFGLTSLGLVFGVLGISEALSGSLGSYFSGYIFDRVGSYMPIFGIGLFLSIAGIILAWKLKPVAWTSEKIAQNIDNRIH